MSTDQKKFNPPPGWPKPPPDWQPPAGWSPDPSWPALPDSWELWIMMTSDAAEVVSDSKPAPFPKTDDVASLQAKIVELQSQIKANQPQDEVIIFSDEAVLQSIGIYRYHHPLENAATYKEMLNEIEVNIVALVKNSQAIEVSNMFTFENSLAKGKKMSSDLGKLMLRAYNAESDNCIRSLRAGNIQTAKKRLESSRKAIAKLGSLMEMRISDDFHQLRLQEIELTSDWLMKKHDEKEQQKEERARIREEKRVEKELSEERERLDKEKSHLENAINALLQKGESDPELEEKLSLLNNAITQNDYRLANIRSGYVYVISNRGAFGENVVKIGLTRRLEPNDRINELGGASVPFRFDVHALFFSEDAVTLENELHHHFRDKAVNVVNKRKEFFFARPSEVREVLIEKVGNLLEFSETAESLEYFQSNKYWPENINIEQ
jgi:hypothetical protein